MTARELARLYALMRPGETFAGVVVTVIGGRQSYRMVLERERDGKRKRRVVSDEDEQEAGAALWPSVELGFGVVTKPLTVSLPVATGLLCGLAEVLANVLKAHTPGYLFHDGAAEARTGPEPHQKHVNLSLLVLALSFEQIGHIRHSFMMPRHVAVSS